MTTFTACVSLYTVCNPAVTWCVSDTACFVYRRVRRMSEKHRKIWQQNNCQLLAFKHSLAPVTVKISLCHGMSYCCVYWSVLYTT